MFSVFISRATSYRFIGVLAHNISTKQKNNGYLIRSFSVASASNFTGSLLSSNEDAFFTINRKVQTCSSYKS
jgi:hypothetical protein